jgi:Holliday junction resolvase-like predicted endonuclease
LGWAECQALSTAELGRAAEEMAVRLLVKHRVLVLARNLNVGRGEIDILALIRAARSVVEVRSVRQGREWIDPISAFDEAKSRQVRRLAGQVGAGRVDLVTVSFSSAGVDLHWLPWAG